MKGGKKTKEEIVQVTMMINDFADSSVERRVNSAKNIKLIAQTLGVERVKKQLIPFLKQEVTIDQTPVVLALLEKIQTIGEFLGGGQAYTILFPLLEELIENQQQKCRKKAIDKYYEIIILADPQKCENQIVASLKKLYNSEYEYAKEAFCCVVARKLGIFSPPNQQDMLNHFQSIVESNSLIQRKFAAMYAKDLVQWLNCSEVTILKIVEVLFKDKEQAHKICLIEAIIELSKLKSSISLQPYFNLISYQFTWRIRYELISKVERLAQAMGKENFKSFLTYFIKYLNDIEPEIRSIANLKLEHLVNFIEVDDIINRVIPALKSIPQDTHVYVRCSLAESLLSLCGVIGKKSTSELILPKFLQLLKDESEQVRLTIFKKVDIICSSLGIEILSQSVLPVLTDMFLNPSWRARVESIEIFFYFIKNSPVDFLNEKHIKFIQEFLKDKASNVRKETIKLLVKVLDHHGQPWFEKNIMPKITPMFKSTTFLQRQTILLTIQTLIPKLSVEYLAKNVFASIFALVQDPVENVRLSVCDSLEVLYVHLPQEKMAIKKLLKNLKDDKDNDVKELADQIFAKLN